VGEGAANPESEAILLVSEPILGREEEAALADVIQSGWITMGQRVRSFEEAFALAHAKPDAVAVNSCTAALHLILAALGIGPRDEVLVPSLTFVATANSVVYTGAKPVFVDIEGLDTPFLSLVDAAAKCTTRTKAVIVVHFAGYLVDSEAWQQFARERGLHLIEDAAHAAGVREVGSIGEAAAFSFYGNKNMTTAEGGAVTASDPEVLEKVRQMRQHGMTTGTFQRLSSRQAAYDVSMLGFNYRMDELRAALGLVQLQRLAEWNAKRKALTRQYLELLYERCSGVLAPFRKFQGSSSSNHIMPIILPEKTDRQDVVDKLRDHGIQTTIHYPPAHSFSFYREHYPTAALPLTEEFSRRELTLPLHPRLELEHIQKVVRALAAALSQNQ
jgi:dTDP-4-amino-4,6-dideoxygalactose transaminase